AIAHLMYSDNLEMLKGSDVFIEAIVEGAGGKEELFKKLASLATHHPVLASHTRSISITEIAASVAPVADRVIGMHFFNAGPVMKLVEVIKGLQTSDRTVHVVMELAKAMGKTPIPANDRPGFVSNRVLMPMINEAFYAWMEG